MSNTISETSTTSPLVPRARHFRSMSSWVLFAKVLIIWPIEPGASTLMSFWAISRSSALPDTSLCDMAMPLLTACVQETCGCPSSPSHLQNSLRRRKPQRNVRSVKGQHKAEIASTLLTRPKTACCISRLRMYAFSDDTTRQIAVVQDRYPSTGIYRIGENTNDAGFL
jgi:hypothetical protein